jgi:molybdate transport system substrate-binding protein
MHSTLRTLLAVSVIFAGPAQAATVYAAASLTDVLDAITEKYQQTRPADIRLSYASSSTLARQIEAGAPADLYISADEQWMDYLSERDLIDKDSRRSLLRNRLVMIAPAEHPRQVAMSAAMPPGFDGRLCMGETDSVPAGVYGRQALTSLGWWPMLEARVAGMQDVRAALAFVARGECPLGIVYETDTRVTDQVMIAGRFPEHSHTPVSYPAALLPGADATARDFLDYLGGPEATALFRAAGFTVIAP